MVPKTIRGQWIWLPETRNPADEYVLFRTEVVLGEMPASAELWFTVFGFCHVFVNGRHAGFGPWLEAPDPYLMFVDASYYLAPGRNVIAILAHQAVTRRNPPWPQRRGLWCQLDIDGEPAVWSDSEWRVRHADHYGANRPRRHPNDTFNELVDMRVAPLGWEDDGYEEDDKWQQPAAMQGPTAASFSISAMPETNSGLRQAHAVVGRGSCVPAKALTHLCFADTVQHHGPGIYAGRSYLYSPRYRYLRVRFFCDTAYRIFLNGQLVREQGVKPVREGQEFRLPPSPVVDAEDVVPVGGTIEVQEGWNDLVFFQEVANGGGGLSMLFSDLDPEEFTLYRETDAEVEHPRSGWRVSGPLRTPLARTTPHIPFDTMGQVTYNPDHSPVGNETAILESREFTPDPAVVPGVEERRLKSGEYIVYDFDAVNTGCPELHFDAAEADVLDVVTSQELCPETGRVPFRCNNRQDVDTILCGSGESTWISSSPRGCRYVMVVVRHAQDEVILHSCSTRVLEYALTTEGLFECDKQVVNEIWQAGARTLQANLQGVFLNTPMGGESSIPDAMVQSWSAYHVLGTYELVGKTIADFAQGQFETGEMPPVFPAVKYCHQPMYSLLWPTWLQRHYLYTGDATLVRTMIPAMVRLFQYFSISSRGVEVLEVPGDWPMLRDFGDFSETMQRGVSTGLNAMYVHSLFSGAHLLADIGGMDAEADLLRSRAQAVSRRIRDLCWNEEMESFADWWQDGAVSDMCSWQTDVLAAYGGIIPEYARARVLTRLFEEEYPEDLGASPFFKFFLLESALQTGYRRWALEHLVYYWGGLLSSGARTFSESYDPQETENTVQCCPRCRGRSVLPNGYLVAELAGLRPATPGFATVVFNPVLGVVNHLKAQVPTVHGHLVVEWESRHDEHLEVFLDASYPIDVIPLLPYRVAANATLHVSDNVSILVNE